jgi:hypothetical protein
VENWVKENEERIRLVFLPSPGLELNPDELLNQDVKSNAWVVNALVIKRS